MKKTILRPKKEKKHSNNEIKEGYLDSDLDDPDNKKLYDNVNKRIENNELDIYKNKKIEHINKLNNKKTERNNRYKELDKKKKGKKKLRRKTVDRGGKYNNIQSTYVIYSKRDIKFHIIEPSTASFDKPLIYDKNRKNKKETKGNVKVTYRSSCDNFKIKNKKKKKEKEKIINNFKSHYSLSKAGKDELGNTKTNQDTYLILTNINGLKHFNIFGVLDGHGPEGHLVSQFISNYIEIEFENHPKLENVKNIEEIYSILKSKNFEIIKKIFINADHALKKEDIDYKNSGTTCVLVIHVGEHIICANAGDSRAILIFDEENDENLNSIKVFPLSFDNKPENPQEKERILKMGGTVEKLKNKKGHGIGPYRVWIKNKDYPGLAMSRSIGDFHGKKVGVIADPEIIEYNLSIYSKFITICSDGVWEFLNNEDVMNIGKKFYLENNPRGFCKELISKSVQYWEKEDSAIDDITVVIVFF